MDPRTAFLRSLATFQWWQGLILRPARSQIILMVANGIHRGRGKRVRGGRGGEIKGSKGLELCVRHTEVCGSWEGEGELVSTPEAAGGASHRAL